MINLKLLVDEYEKFLFSKKLLNPKEKSPKFPMFLLAQLSEKLYGKSIGFKVSIPNDEFITYVLQEQK